MSTGKQINAMVVVLFAVLIVIGAYTIWDPFRSIDAEEAQLEKSADFGGELFERNCRLCHGDRGEGGVEGGRLRAAPPLNTDALQGIEEGVLNPALKASEFERITNTIMCGRIGTQMPTWGEDHGGTLNDEQVKQLVILITEGRWHLAEEHADHTDAAATGHAEVEAEDGTFAADETDLVVSNAGPFTLGQYIRIGEERLRVLPNQLLVERGVDGTEAVDHGRGTQLLVDGEPVLINQSPTLRDGQLVLLGGAVISLAENIDAEATALPVADNSQFDEGDVVQLEDELVRVTGATTGLPTTGVFVAKQFRREPTKILVTSAGEIQEGDVIRIGAELMEVGSLGEAGTGVELDVDVAGDSSTVSIEEAQFLRRGYQFRVGDEWMEVIAPVETGQALDATVGRAQSRLSITGTQGIEEGMTIRIDDELMEITEIIRPAQAAIERAQNDSSAGSHAAGTLLQIPADEDAEDQAPTETGQAIIEAVNADETAITLTSTTRINIGDSYLLGNETITISDVTPAIVRIERGARGTDEAEHGRRAPIYFGNYLNVERGINGTDAASHSEGDEVILTQLAVRRAVDSKPLEHGKSAEIFQANHLTVARGVLETEAEDHESGAVVRNFPAAPDSPPYTGVGISVCGQSPVEAPPTPGGPTATPDPNRQNIAVDLNEYNVIPVPESGTSGSFAFNLTNTGGTIHNFRVIATDLAPDALPTTGTTVDEDTLDVVASSGGDLNAGENQSVAIELEAGDYVLICNVPTHYGFGMYTAFSVQ